MKRSNMNLDFWFMAILLLMVALILAAGTIDNRMRQAQALYHQDGAHQDGGR